MRGRSWKLQIPKSKLQKHPKSQNPSSKKISESKLQQFADATGFWVWDLGFGVRDFSGAWDLDLRRFQDVRGRIDGMGRGETGLWRKSSARRLVRHARPHSVVAFWTLRVAGVSLAKGRGARPGSDAGAA